MADKTLEQLKTLLDGGTYKAFKTRLNAIIDRKVNERVAVIEEQKLEAIRVIKDKLQKKAEQFTADKTRELETQFNAVLEESKKQMKDEMVQSLLLMESKLVSHLDRVLEESVNTNTPTDILEEAVKAQHYGKVAKAVASVIEEQNIVIDKSGSSRIQELEQMVSQLNGKLMEEQTARENISNRANSLQRELLLESKTSGLDEDGRKKILGQFRESSYEVIQEQIDKSIELLQESRKQERRGRVANNNTLVGDSAPNMNLSGGKKLIEEEVKNPTATARPPVLEESVQAPSVFDAIDDLLP